MPQQLWLQFVFIEAAQCLGQIFGTSFGQIAGIEPLACTEGSSRNCRQCYEVSAGPGELKSGAVIDCFVFFDTDSFFHCFMFLLSAQKFQLIFFHTQNCCSCICIGLKILHKKYI